MNGRIQVIQGQLQAQWQNNKALQAARHWYQALPSRDRLVVKGVAALLVLALVFVTVYAPLMRSQKAAALSLEKNLATYNLLADNAHRFGVVSSAATDAPILATVTQQAKKAGIVLSRYEQDGKGLRVWVEKAAFDDAITWLEGLQARHAIRVSQINIDRTDRSGLVDIRATLTP
ncbi:MAG: type II secretion system protein M [Saccharospirillaceae bacterium]|nr:type II secretion system protein M [Saccharospirillaceae bacterium]MCD8531718.1 type II secretion system protein M [Saccharospirillaceae bacterium]